ncbi:MAG: sulfur reduction protein DsrS [Gammaproteobacteria bacterium]|nr:sulfur reduction protein DsrS [Gammaproteobacteria bacterium]
MDLSSEDALRLNVLLANNPLAIRINESSMTLHGLLKEGEASINLNPVGTDEKYLKTVRAFLSERALGSPGGYPLYLQRWTRMGRMRDDSLEQLLLLGDATAVFAVVCSANLSDELARRAWWASEEAENARRMLQTPEVAKGETGPRLAEYLIEYLPFETETETMIESIRMALQPGLLDSSIHLSLWKKAARKSAYLVGFIGAIPNDLPEKQPEHPLYPVVVERLNDLISGGSAVAQMIRSLLSLQGQAFLQTCSRILAKPNTQDVVNTTLDIMRDYCVALRPGGNPDLNLDELSIEADALIEQGDIADLVQICPEIKAEVKAACLMSGLGYGVLRPHLRGSTAMGSVMRKQLTLVLDQLQEMIHTLRGISS